MLGVREYRIVLKTLYVSVSVKLLKKTFYVSICY